MIDLHCHIVPGVDDGAQTIEDSLAMARQGAADGIEMICATPHIRHDHDVRIAELARRVGELNGELGRRRIATRIATGGEVAETALAHATDEELRLVALGGGGRWILVEPAPGPLSDTLLASVQALLERGFRSVIAHPERHLAPGAEERLTALIDRGAVVQATAAYLVAGSTAPTMAALANRGLIHVLGSDAHSPRHGRAVRLSDGLEALGAIEVLGPHLEWIAWDAPAAIVRGEEIEPPYGPSLAA